MSARGVRYVQAVAAVIAISLLCSVPGRAEEAANGKMTYRGFTVDLSALRDANRRAALTTSIKHQIDIVADCRAKPEVLSFFRSQEIVVRPDLRQHGHFDSRGPGIEIDDKVQAPQKPIVLHELLHAYHFRALPDGVRNSDLIRFYNRAKISRLYPAHEYLLTNVKEFFAVTGSLYLWGNVDRAPHTRERLAAAQPIYYRWLGQLFGVQK